MIKLIWYFFSISLISLVLINNPNSSNTISQNKIFTFNSNQLFIQKIIFINVILFILCTVLYSVYIVI
uniref:Preprotein-translocase subunit g n=1 Tax=Taenioma perpusillum TaxID=210852 RepID=A0A1Z1MQZ5_9FLOR|nr:preprotein-translocase subunit g [Taenioma perpusillum]ARW68523.1 preprotein-translocase subunit g [Taenioma perpusillum]